MTQLALYPKRVGAAAPSIVGDDPPLWDTQGGESKSIVILLDVTAKLFGDRILSCKQVLNNIWWWLEGGGVQRGQSCNRFQTGYCPSSMLKDALLSNGVPGSTGTPLTSAQDHG